MDSTNRFLAGMNQDVHPTSQPENSTRMVVNFVPLTKSGNLYALSNEDGTVLCNNITFPNNLKVIGNEVLNNEIIVVLANEAGNSAVGVIKMADYSFTLVAPVLTGVGPVSDNSEFNFSLLHPVDTVARKLINGHRILYYTDNYNPYGRVDLDDPPVVGQVTSQSALQFSQQIPIIDLTNILEGQGSGTFAGIYFFVTRYITRNGNTTQFSIPSAGVPLVKTFKSVGVNAYEGASIDTDTGKAIQLTISNIDLNYAQLEVFVIRYTGAQSAFTMSRFVSRTISNPTETVIYSGPVDGAIDVTQEELNKLFATYTHAKCIEQKDNILHLSNLRDDTTQEDINLQAIANNIIVQYEVSEVQYNGRGETVNLDLNTFTLLASPQIYSIAPGSSNAIILSFNGPVTTVSTVTLRKNGSVATATIDFTTTNPVDGDTITIDGIVYTARVAPTLSSEFLIGATPDDTAFNFRSLVNALTYFYKVPSITGAIVNLRATLVDLADNGKTVVSSNVGIITTDFAGASTTITDYTKTFAANPTDFTITGNTVIVNFTSDLAGDYISTIDQLQIGLVTSPKTVGTTTDPSGNTFTTGTNFIAIGESGSSVAIPSGSAGFTDYINEPLTFYSKGYMRDEVYSLGFFLIYKDGSLSVNYHIPGFNYPGLVNGKFENPNWADKKLGTYQSASTYPINQGYPGPVGTQVRHHLIPSIAIEPTFRNDSDNQFIRILNLKFTNFILPPIVAARVQGVVFTRERRNTIGNTSILGQGIINRSVETADNFVGAGGNIPKWPVDGATTDGVRAGYNMIEMPLFNNLERITATGSNPGKYGAQAYGGMAYPFMNGGGGSYSDGTRMNTLISQRQVWFHCPETILNFPSLCTDQNAIGGKLKRQNLLLGDAIVANYGRDAIFREDTPVGNAKYRFRRCLFFDAYCNYKNQISPSGGWDATILNARMTLPGNAKNSPLDPSRPGWRTSTFSSQGGLEILLSADVENPGGDKLRGEKETPPIIESQLSDLFPSDYDDYSTIRIQATNTPLGLQDKFNVRNYLYNLEKENPQQYGDLGQGGYIPIGRFTYTGGAYSCFGGDTYISKFALNTGNVVPYWAFGFEDGWFVGSGDGPLQPFIPPENRYIIGRFDGVGSNAPVPNTGRSNGYLHPDNTPINGWDFRATSFFFVESTLNTNYRYKEADVDGKARQNYFPHNPNQSNQLNDWIPPFGNSIGYNSQYSFENSSKLYYSRVAGSQVLSIFENRDIYSEQAKNDDILDTYQNLLPNSFYDLPSNTGMIWDSFVYMNTLYFHTPKGLWATFAEPTAQLEANDISEVVLGTGGLFIRPSQLILTSQGGYAGSISQFGGINSNIGYIFPDVLQRKHFVLGGSGDGPQLKDLTEMGLYTFYRENVNVDESLITTMLSHLIDNPFIGIGFAGGYDFNLKRAVITYHGVNPFTLSFSTVTGNWISFHDYKPNSIIQFNNQLMFIDSSQVGRSRVYRANEGNKGEFFGVVYPSRVEWIINGPGAKTFSNIVVMSESYDGDVLVRDDNFETIQVWSDRMNSGVRPVVNGNDFNSTKLENEVWVKFRNDQYRLAIPRDAVVDNSQDIMDPNNIYQPMGNVAQNDAYFFKERVKGNYVHVNFVYNNTNNYNFIINFIQSIFGQNIR